MAKTARGLVAHARAQVGHYYWYGTFGQRPTLDLLDRKRRMYPSIWTAARYDHARNNHVGDMRRRAFDCSGLIKSYWMMETPDSNPRYIPTRDKSAAMLRALCTQRGNIASIPEEPGLLVFIGTGHVGVYIGNGQVVDARGFSHGVVETRLNARAWDTWGRLSWLEGEREETACHCQCNCCVRMRRNGLPCS